MTELMWDNNGITQAGRNKSIKGSEVRIKQGKWNENKGKGKISD